MKFIAVTKSGTVNLEIPLLNILQVVHIQAEVSAGYQEIRSRLGAGEYAIELLQKYFS